MPYQREIKAIRLLQDRGDGLESSHSEIASDLEQIKQRLSALGADDTQNTPEFETVRQTYLDDPLTKPLDSFSLSSIYKEAEAHFPQQAGLADILTVDDFAATEHRISCHVHDFNARYSLDAWDYAIAGGCGLFTAMLDWLCVSAPLKPTIAHTQQVDGIFNRLVQDGFNTLLPPELSKQLGKNNKIGAPDASTVFRLFDAPEKALNPMNHRLRAMSHDPVLGVLFGVWDMMHNTCTAVVNGRIQSIPALGQSPAGDVFSLIGRMFGHLLSDVNAPSPKGNRGMGLPAPFMGLLRMGTGIPLGDSTLDKQIEWMYVNGYDFRQFAASTIPLSIMEVLLRVFYVGKQVHEYQAPFGQTLLDTMPMRLNPRFRIMLALAYGTVTAINSGRVHITGNLLNANYAAWMGFAWNGFHALKWGLVDRHLKLWAEVEDKEIAALKETIVRIEELETRAERLQV